LRYSKRTATKVMRKAVLLASALTMLGHAVFAQISLGPERRPFLTADQLTAVVGSESEAGAIVSRALLYGIRGFATKTTTVIGAQIPEKWLPVIPGVQIVRLSDNDARAHFQQCGRLLFVNSFTRAESDVVVIDVAEGNKCQIGGWSLRFNRRADGWRLVRDGIPGGFGSGAGDCGC
jgi:hypothetical protein